MKKQSLLTLCACLLLTGCSQKSFDEQMAQKAKDRFDATTLKQIKSSYSESLAGGKSIDKIFVSVSEDKYLSSVLKELESIDKTIYYLKGQDFIVPSSTVKINSLQKLDTYLQAVSNKRLSTKVMDDLTLVYYEDVSAIQKEKLSQIKFSFDGEISVSEYIKLIKEFSNYQVSFGAYLSEQKDFFNEIIYIKANNLLDAITGFSYSKNLFVNIDYENKIIEYSKYKNSVIELNIPMLNLRTSSNATASVDNTETQSKIENKSTVYLYDELNNILKSIIGNDAIASFHIDQSSGLIYLKSTKIMQEAVRTVVKAYEESFAKEAVIEFERIELLLNKGHTYGISSLGAQGKTTDITGALVSYDGSSPNLSITNKGDLNSLSLRRITDIEAKANYQIGYVLNYSKNLMVLKNNIPAVQSLSQNTDYIEQIDKTVSENNSVSTRATVNTIKDGTSITARAKISRDKIFLNITPQIKKFIQFNSAIFEQSTIQLPEYKDQSYNISREIGLGETLIVGSIIVHDDATDYEGIIPLEGFAIGGADNKSYVRREIVYAVTLKSVKGF